jgi:hypothetical protein
MSEPDNDADSARTWVLRREDVPHQSRPADTLEMRIVLYDDLELLATRDPQLSHLVPDPKYRKLAKNPKTKRTAAWMANLYLSKLVCGSAVSDDERWVLILWCAKQRVAIKPGWLKPRGRGRPHDSTKEFAVRVAYARKVEQAPERKKESIVAELMKEYGLKRRRVREFIKGADPEFLLRALRPLPGRPVPQWSDCFPGDSPYGDGSLSKRQPL